jgi:integrase
MAGATVRAIQELAGHASITTTQMYMHLSPGAGREAIDLLMVYRRGSSVAAEAGGEKKKKDSGK